MEQKAERLIKAMRYSSDGVKKEYILKAFKKVAEAQRQLTGECFVSKDDKLLPQLPLVTDTPALNFP